MKLDAHANALSELWAHLTQRHGAPFPWVVEHAPDGTLDLAWRACRDPYYLVDVAAHAARGSAREAVFKIVEDIIAERAASAFRTMGRPAIGAWQGYVVQAVARRQWSHAGGMLAGEGKYGEPYRAAASDMKMAVADVHTRYSAGSLSDAVSTLRNVIAPSWFAARFRKEYAAAGLAIPTIARLLEVWPEAARTP